jgi:hypothetical protein
VIVINERRANASAGMWLRAWECDYESENARARARAGEQEREQEHECEVLITWCWGQETKYEVERRDLRLQRDSDMRGEVLLIFWYVQRSVYIVWNFKMKSWQLINFTACAKDRGLIWKSNLQNYHIRLITPVQLSHDLHDISESLGQSWAKALCWCSLAILIYRHASVLGNCFTKP